MIRKSQQTNSNQGQSLLKEFASFVVRYKSVQASYYSIGTHMIYHIALIIPYLQMISFVEFVIKKSEQTNQIALDQILMQISIISRPYLYFQDVTIKYVYIIAVVANLSIILDICYHFRLYREQTKNKNIQNLMQYIELQSFVGKLTQNLVQYIITFYHDVFFLMFIDMCMISNTINFQEKQAYNYINITISILFFLLSILFEIGYLFILNESIEITNNSNQRINGSSAETLQPFILFLLSFIDQLHTNTDIQIILYSVLIFTYCLRQLESLLKNQEFINESKNVTAIGANSFVIIYLIGILVQRNQNRLLGPTLILLLFPVIFHLLLKIKNTIQESNVNLETCRISTLQIILAKNITKLGNKKTQNVNIHQQIFLHKHCRECFNSNCFCTQQLINPDTLIKHYCSYLAQLISKKLEMDKNKSEKFIFYLHLISATCKLGLTTQAFQQTNMMLCQNTSFTYSQGIKLRTLTNRKSVSSSNSQPSVAIQNNEQQIIDRITKTQRSFIDQAKLVTLQESIKVLMSTAFQQSQGQQDQESLSHAVGLFLQSEEDNNLLRQKTIKMINQRREYLGNLLDHQINQSNNKYSTESLFSLNIKLIKQLNKLGNKIQLMYNQFPSQRLQSVHSFYQAELIGNYLAAYRIVNVTAISDDKLLKMHKNMQINLFSNKISYMIANYDKKTQNMKLQCSSNQIHQLFDYNYEEFTKLENISQLIPNGFLNIHNYLIQQFLKDGQSKYFKNIELNFIRMRSGLLNTVDFFYDMNFQNLNDLTFVMFLQHKPTLNPYFMINQSNKLVGITKDFFQKVGIYQRQLNPLFLRHCLYQTNINKIIYNFSKLLYYDGNQEGGSQLLGNFSIRNEGNQIRMSSIQMRFLNSEFIQKGNFQKHEYKKDIWNDPSNFNLFNITIDVYKREKDQVQYFIIELLDIKRARHESDNQYLEQPQLSINSLMSIQQEEQVHSPKALNLQNQSYLYNDEDNQDRSNNMEFDGQFNLPQAQAVQQIEVNMFKQQPMVFQSYLSSRLNFSARNTHMANLFSPKDSFSALIQPNQTTSQLRKNDDGFSQQHFFNATVNKESFSQTYKFDKEKQQEANDASSYNNNQEIQQLNKQIRKELEFQLDINQQSDKEQNVIQYDDVGSQVSSLAGFRKTKYFRKYELIDKYLQSNKYPQINKIFIVIYLLSLLTQILYSSLILVNTDQDINRFLQEITMVQFNSFFMAPYYKYLLGQYTLLSYIFLTVFMRYDPVKTDKAADLFRYQNKLQYQELKDNFNFQLSNKYLTEFFTDQYINVTQISDTELAAYNMSFRSALFLIMDYSYDFQLALVKGSAPIDSSYMTYFHSNIFTFADRFQVINNQIYDYSIQRAVTTQNKWIYTLVPFFLMIIIYQFYCWRSYLTMLSKYSQILQLNNHINQKFLRKDIQRYKILSEILHKKNDLIFQYKFDIDLKEAQLKLDEKSMETQQQTREYKQSSNFQQFHFSPIKSFIVLFLLLMANLCTLLIINIKTVNYLEKYQPSVKFFTGLSELTVSLNSMYAYREICYYQVGYKVFFFWNNSISDQVYEKVINDIAVMDNFMDLIINFNNDDYLLSSDYMNDLVELRENNVCNFLDPEYYNEAVEYCDQIYEGVLLRGLQNTLTQIKSTIFNEMSINNFTRRSGFPFRENEIVFIATRVLSRFQQNFSESLKQVTQDQIVQLNVISGVQLVYCVISMFILVYYLKYHWIQEYQQVKQFILLIPQTTLFIDSHLDRNFRQMIVAEDAV